MAKPPSPFLLSLTLLLFSNPLLLAFADDETSTYKAFLSCMESSTDLGENIGNLIYFSKTNASSYSSTLRAYIRNARFNTTAAPKPLVIVAAARVSHVQAAVLCVQITAPEYRLKIRSGGHDFDGLSYVSDAPFFVLDMFSIREISVDVASKTAWVQAGATLGELYYGIWKESEVLGFPAGVCPTVGVGGHISGGGYGNMMRKYGLSVDNVIDAQVVDVNGKLLDRAGMGEDFFWAIRGGGGASFGVVVAYKINLVDVPETVTVFRVDKYMEDNAIEMVYNWQSVAPATTDDLFMRMMIQPVTSKKVKSQPTVRVSVMALYLGGSDALVEILGKELPSLGLNKTDCMEMSWIRSALWWDSRDGTTPVEFLLDRDVDHAKFLKRKSDYVQKIISKDDLNSIFNKILELNKTELVFNAYGGKMNKIQSFVVPFPHRAGNLFKIQYSVNWEDPGGDADNEYMTQIRKLYSFMTPFVSQNPRSAYLNYRDVDIGIMEPGKDDYQEGSVYGLKYFNGNFDRLVKVKTAVDPNNFFRYEQSIPTLPRDRSVSEKSCGCSMTSMHVPLIRKLIGLAIILYLFWGHWALIMQPLVVIILYI